MTEHLFPARLEAETGNGPGGPSTWIAGHREEIGAAVAAHGAVLVRGLPVDSRDSAIAAVRAVLVDPMAEREAFAPRDHYEDGIYSSTHWPADQPMCMHHELSYAAEVPRLLAFACVTPPAAGGVTALADSAAVLADLPSGLVDRFERHGWRLDRHYNPYVGTSWQEAFGTGDRTEVERYCATNGVQARWHDDGALTTRQTRPAVLTHPDTGERCWFNQIAFLNEWTMAPEVRDYLLSELGPESLPFNTFSGDGAGLDRATVDHINEVYEKHTVREPWQRGDLLVVDNLRIAHDREPYKGEREIVVGLGTPFRP